MTQFVELIENVFRSLAGLAVGIERIADLLQRQQGIDSADRATPRQAAGRIGARQFHFTPQSGGLGFGTSSFCGRYARYRQF